ncbi:MAG: biotin/lipoyl-binding protein [Acidimicrobiaceae bacterium]|nr:biotin/lipoyl-binding protein [Acidimicrobiaceae bacterium]
MKRLLIANRGEIARRIARTAKAMGIDSVAVYAAGDAASPLLDETDWAVALAGRTAAETYLNIEALLDAAARSGADAVHPGYGFLSERAAFARAVLDAGLTWVGPPPDVIDAMGDKRNAKRTMTAAGVPVLPTLEAGQVRFPVIVKAAAGGGGKGMRIVTTENELPDALAAAQREAEAAFGDPTVFLERFVPEARHVEIQILADQHGQVIHCFERECSIQRRHQKVIEEAPSPAVDDDLRDRMGAAAVAGAKAVGYVGAGTVEFMLEPSGEFWFLEVNTRLQVEHPVTEAITRRDLVREQLLIAQGRPLSFGQADLTITGHAVEARLYAEDPEAGFLPATGTLVDWAPEPGVRWDSGVEAGSVIGVEWDPLLAKAIAHAPTRAEAAGRLAGALARSRVRGVTTNRDFLVATLRHPDFLAGETTTEFIARSQPRLRWEPDEAQLADAATAAALAAQHQAREAASVLRSLPTGWRVSVMPPQRRCFGDVTVEYQARRDGTFDVTACDRRRSVRFEDHGGGWVTLEMEGRRLRAHVLQAGNTVWVQTSDGDLELHEVPRFPEPEPEAVAGALAAPMPGKVLAVEVAQGDAVEQGQLLVIVEAMKMEHRVTAPHAGTVVNVRVRAGDQVTGGDLLVVLEEQ